MTKQERDKLNAQRLQKVYVTLRPKLQAVLDDMEGHGWQPLIDAAVHRTPAEQLALFNKGYSKTKFSFHNCTGKGNTPESLAADITDARHGWSSPSKFWLMLTASAEAHGLSTGIRWGLSKAERQTIDKALASRNFDAKINLGWDTAHVEVQGISLLAARLGKRPK